MQNFISFPESRDDSYSFNSSLFFYYLESQKETRGYELYDGEGYIGFTPSSWSNDMGIFHMFKTIDQDKEMMLDLYSFQHMIGLEIHHA